MLKNLNSVDWATLGTPEMSHWLEGMASHDFDIREEAYNNFYDSGVTDLNKATPYVVPFLIELLTYQDTPKKDYLLQLLIVLASEALAYSDHPKLVERAKPTLVAIRQGKSVFETYVENDDTKALALELLTYTK